MESFWKRECKYCGKEQSQWEQYHLMYPKEYFCTPCYQKVIVLSNAAAIQKLQQIQLTNTKMEDIKCIVRDIDPSYKHGSEAFKLLMETIKKKQSQTEN